MGLYKSVVIAAASRDSSLVSRTFHGNALLSRIKRSEERGLEFS